MKISSIVKTVAVLVAVVAMSVFTCSASDNFTVVIDAGHGGKDVGAADNGVKEKDINLGVAKELASYLNGKKGIKVVMTRDKDEYLTLQRRAEIANNAKGNIFVSIHTNSAAAENPNRTKVAGSSTHVLGESKDANNLAVTQRENSVIKLEKNYQSKYQGFDPDNDESYIIFEMMQKNNQRRSIYLAEAIQKELTTKAGRRNRGVQQNGFWVLWATSMPAVLVELDFICNPNSAKYISSKEGQKQLAESIGVAIMNYYNQHSNRAFEVIEEKDDLTRGIKNDVAVLSNASARAERTAAPKIKASANTSGNKRRRRSDAAKVKSSNRNLEASEKIIINTTEEYAATMVTENQSDGQDGTATVNMVSVDEQKTKSKKDKKAKNVKHATKNRTVNEVVTASENNDKNPKANKKVDKGAKKEKVIDIKGDNSEVATAKDTGVIKKAKTNNKNKTVIAVADANVGTPGKTAEKAEKTDIRQSANKVIVRGKDTEMPKKAKINSHPVATATIANEKPSVTPKKDNQKGKTAARSSRDIENGVANAFGTSKKDSKEKVSTEVKVVNSVDVAKQNSEVVVPVKQTASVTNDGLAKTKKAHLNNKH